MKISLETDYNINELVYFKDKRTHQINKGLISSIRINIGYNDHPARGIEPFSTQDYFIGGFAYDKSEIFKNLDSILDYITNEVLDKEVEPKQEIVSYRTTTQLEDFVIFRLKD